MKKRALKLLASLLIFCFLFKLMDFFFIPVTFDHWANHDRKMNESKIDTLVLGDSLGMYCFQPGIYDKKTSSESYNASSAGQTTLDSFFLAKDFLKSTPNLKRIIMITDYYVFRDDQTFDVFWINDIVLNRIKNIPLKAEYLYKTNSIDNYYKFIFRKDLYKFNYKSIAQNVKTKLNYEYRHFDIITQAGAFYMDKGYICTYSENFSAKPDVSMMPLNNKTSYEYFEMLIDLCRDNNIELTVFQSPITSYEMSSLYYYDEYYGRISGICEKDNIDFWDFNKYNFQNKLDPSKDYKDNVHLNYSGSCKFMDELCKVISGDKQALKNFELQ